MKSLGGLTMIALLALGSGCAQAVVEEGDVTTAAIVEPKAAKVHSAIGTLVEGDTVRCTGTLIAPDVVLTAAHCFTDASKLDFVIGAGAAERRFTAKASGDEEHPYAFVHPQYADGQHDLAYVVLTKPVASVVARPARIGSHTDVADCDFDVVAAELNDLNRTANICLTGARAGLLTATTADGASCVGDSGGGLLLRGQATDVIVGVGGDACEDGEKMHFTALASERAFVRKAVAAGKPQVAFD